MDIEHAFVLEGPARGAWRIRGGGEIGIRIIGSDITKK